MRPSIQISFIIASIVIMTFFLVPPLASQTPAPLSIVGPADTAAAGPANMGVIPHGSGSFITIGQNYRIRQNGTIKRIKIYTANKTGLVGFYVTIWRKNGTAFDLVGQSNNLVGDLVSEDFALVDLRPPIPGVVEGDYYGYRIEWGETENFFAKNSINANTYYVTNALPDTSQYDWLSQEKLNPQLVLPIEFYMDAPDIVFIGDSIISGFPNNRSFLEIVETTEIPSTIENQFSGYTRLVYQNMGLPGQTTTQIAQRFLADAVALSPHIIVADGGINDIGLGLSFESFMSNWKFMLDETKSRNIVLLAQAILSCSKCNEEQMLLRDQWNLALKNLVGQYPNAAMMDASEYIGQFRPTGPEGNLWDVKQTYDSEDGVHFNKYGNQAIAFAIAAQLNFVKKSDFIPPSPAASCSLTDNR